LKNDFYRFQIKDMKDKRGMGMIKKSDTRGEGLGDINTILGHSLTKFQKGKEQRFNLENELSGDEYEGLDEE
jgi:hypothetical protein